MVALDRRALLRTGAATALAGAGTALTAPPASALATAPAPAEVTRRDWQELQSQITGPVVLPPAANYFGLNTPENHRYADILSAGIVCPSTAQDVARAAVWAGVNGLKVVPRSGGHNYAGFSTTTGMLLHLGRMRQTQVDTRAGTITVGAGARNTEVYNALRRTDLLLPGGRCPGVGMGGLTLGGGIGFATRLYGLTCDSLIRTTVVTANGEILVCDENHHPDLFWACRGGAGGNFGVNTSFTYRLHPTDPVTVYDFAWTRPAARPVLEFVSELIEDPAHATTLSAQYGVRTDPDSAVYAQGLFKGEPAQLEALFRPLLSSSSLTSRLIEKQRIWPAMNHFYVNGSGNPYGQKSIISSRVAGADAVNELVAHIDAFPRSVSSASSGSASFFAMGGADGRVPTDETAYVHRGARAILSLTAYWADTDFPEVRRANLDWLERTYANMTHHLGPRAYQNFPDRDLERWQDAYYGSNYPRLVEVKRAYDPRTLFDYPQAVGT